jgi:hypothetical protein
VSDESHHDQRDCRRRNGLYRSATPLLVALPMRQRHEQGQHSDRIDDDKKSYEHRRGKFEHACWQPRFQKRYATDAFPRVTKEN